MKQWSLGSVLAQHLPQRIPRHQVHSLITTNRDQSQICFFFITSPFPLLYFAKAQILSFRGLKITFQTFPLSESVQGQVGWHLEQPGVEEYIPAHGKGVELEDLEDLFQFKSL